MTVESVHAELVSDDGYVFTVIADKDGTKLSSEDVELLVDFDKLNDVALAVKGAYDTVA